jgi:hypothetical protein
MTGSAPTFSRKEAQSRRYRRAAEDALEQLNWCIGYLHGIGKTTVSRALARNRSFIRSELMRQEAEPLPVDRSEADVGPTAQTRRPQEPRRHRSDPRRPGQRRRPDARRAGRHHRSAEAAGEPRAA